MHFPACSSVMTEIAVSVAATAPNHSVAVTSSTETDRHQEEASSADKVEAA